MSTLLTAVNMLLQHNTANNVIGFVTPDNVCVVVLNWWKHKRRELTFVWQNGTEFTLIALQKQQNNKLLAVVNPTDIRIKTDISVLQTCLPYVQLRVVTVPCPFQHPTQCMYWHILVHASLALNPKNFHMLRGAKMLNNMVKHTEWFISTFATPRQQQILDDLLPSLVLPTQNNWPL